MDFLSLAASRKSVRGFNDRPVSEECLLALLEAARLAPSAGNLQPWKFYAVLNRSKIDSLGKESYRAPWFLSAQVVIVVMADAEASATVYGERGRSLYCYQDTAAAVENILLCAASLGLGACWVGAFDEKSCASILSLPRGERPVALIPVGYPVAQPEARPRKPLEEVAVFIR